MEPPPVPDERNAALIYKRAAASLKLSPRDDMALVGLGSQTPDPLESQTRRRVLNENRAAVALVRQAAAMPDCHFPVNWSNPTRVLFPQYAMMRRFARLLTGSAQQEARDGHVEQALKDVDSIFQMSRHLSNEPVLIGLLVSHAVEAIGYGALGRVLQTARITPQQAHAVQQRLPVTKSSKALTRAMLGERAMGLWGIETMRADPSQYSRITATETAEAAPPSLPMRVLMRLVMLLYSPFAKLDEIEYIRYMNRVIARSRQPLFTAKNNPVLLEDTVPWYAPLTRIVSPVYNRLSIHQERSEVKRRMAVVALSLAVYHSARGRYPEQLKPSGAVWGSTLPLDPYSGKEFVYRVENNSFALYTVGPNRRDDDGKLTSNGTGDDISWLPRR